MIEVPYILVVDIDHFQCQSHLLKHLVHNEQPPLLESDLADLYVKFNEIK